MTSNQPPPPGPNESRPIGRHQPVVSTVRHVPVVSTVRRVPVVSTTRRPPPVTAT